MKNVALPLSLAVTIGLVLWAATTAAAGGREPWDTGLYWWLSYPAAVVIAGILGFGFPDRAWLWALALIGSQLVVLAILSPGLGLWPLGLVLLGILSLPAIVVARFAARLRA